MSLNEPDNVTEYFTRHGCDRKTVSFVRSTVVDLVEPLLAIVDKLPQCWRLVDGQLVQDVPVLPGMTLWSVRIWDIKRIEVVSLDDLTSDWPATIRMGASGERGTLYRWHVQGCYSTLEAAEAATEAKEAKP